MTPTLTTVGYLMDPLKSGERGRNRTYNLLIKSQLLCQLSYAPDLGTENLAGSANCRRLSLYRRRG